MNFKSYIMQRKIIQINWETGEVLEKGVIIDDPNLISAYGTMNDVLKETGSKKVWLIEPLKPTQKP